MPAAFITAADLVTWFAANGYGTIDAIEAAELLARSLDDFEQLSQRIPFLAVSGTKYFDTEGRKSNDGYRISLKEYTVLSTSLLAYQVDADGNATLIDAENYDFMPLNHGGDCKPFEFLRLKRRYAEGQIKITGYFGYSLTVPQDVYDAVRDYCVVLKARKLAASKMISAGGLELSKEKVGQVEFTYERSVISSFESTLREVAARHELL